MMLTMTMATGHLGPSLPGSFCFSSHRSLELNWQAHIFYLLVMYINVRTSHWEGSNGTKRISNFNDNSNDPNMTREKVSATSPQPFQLWLPKVLWPRPGSPRTTNNMRFGPRNPETQNFHLHKGVVAKFPAKKFVILPFYKNLHVMRDALPLWQDVAKIFCSQNIPGRLDNIMMTFRQTNLNVVAAKSLVLWL